MEREVEGAAGQPTGCHPERAKQVEGSRAASADSAPTSTPAPASGRGRKALLVSAALLALTAIVLVALALALPQCSREDDGMEPNVVVGTMDGYTDEEIAEMLRKKVDEGMIAFSLNTRMFLESPGAEATVKFENPPNNAKLTKLKLVRDDTGETVYETGFLEPGSYVDRSAFDVEMEPGEHACTGYISSYSLDERKYLGEAACTVIVTVQG